MAEGMEIEISPSSQKYFCHLCARKVSVAHPDLTCRICQSGFVEELSDSDRNFVENVSFDPPPEVDSVESDDSDSEIGGIFPTLESDFVDFVRQTIRSSILDLDPELDRPERERESVSLRNALENGPTARAVIGASNSSRSPQSIEERVILPLITELYGNFDGSFGVHDVFHLASNLGDYAFGSEWDTIITQILNEAELDGPPPLDKKEIDELPLIPVTKEYLSKSIQCTICMEDFKLEEKVKSLPCEHIFHSRCIVPWLEIHATCPICRKTINS